MFKAAVFDLDGTLYDEGGAYDDAIVAAAALAHERFGIADGDFIEAARREFDWQKAKTPGTAAFHNRFVRFQRVLESFGRPPTAAYDIAMRYWQAYLDAISMRPDAAATLAAMKTAGLRIGVGTNMTCAMQLAKIEHIGLAQYIDFVVSSEEAGCEKPALAFFDFVAEKACCSPAEILFCGDNPELDACGSCNAGMRGIWLDAAQDSPPRPGVETVHALSELLPLLG